MARLNDKADYDISCAGHLCLDITPEFQDADKRNDPDQSQPGAIEPMSRFCSQRSVCAELKQEQHESKSCKMFDFAHIDVKKAAQCHSCPVTNAAIPEK